MPELTAFWAVYIDTHPRQGPLTCGSLSQNALSSYAKRANVRVNPDSCAVLTRSDVTNTR